MFRAWLSIVFATLMTANAVRADHACDALGEEGWRIIPSRETVNVTDSMPYRIDSEWYVDRTTTVLPLCNYINAAGSYSLLSYSLSPETKTERVAICRRTPGGIAAVAPYTGPCPPR